MVNKKLELFIIKASGILFVIGFFSVLLIFDHKLPNALAAVGGYLISVLLFESTAMLFGSAVAPSRAQVHVARFVLIGAFLVMLAALRFTLTHAPGMQTFWVLFGGIVVIPATVTIYIVLEAAGLLHTDYFT